MRSFIIGLFVLALTISVYADEYVGGYKFDEFEILQFEGIPEPSVSPTGSARIYHSSSSDTLQVSESGGAYEALVGGGSESTTVSDTTTIDLTLTGSDITADGLYTAGDALTLTGADFDFDGGATPGGELGGTWASPTVDSAIHDDEYVELGDSFVGDVTGVYSSTDITESVLVVGGTDTVFPADPDADGISFWDDDPGTHEWAAIGSGLSYDGTTLTATGSTAWDDIGDPDNDGLTTIDFDNASENTIFTTAYDAAGSFLTIQDSDADLANNTYLLDLDYSVDDDQANADYFKCQDAGGTVFEIQQDGDTAIYGDLAVGSNLHPSITVNGTTKYIQFGVHGDDDANTYVSYMDRASDTHSPTLAIARSRGTHAAPTQVADDDILGQIGFFGWDDTDNDLNLGGTIKGRVHGAAGNNDLPTEIVFAVASDGAATPTEQVTLYDGVLAPITDDDIDIGAAAAQFKDGYFDGTLEADALTEGGNAVYSSGETPSGELGGTYANITIDDSVAVASWNLTTPTITTSIDLPAGAINTATEIAADIITHTQILDADQADTKCLWFEDPTADDDFNSIWANKTANDFLITEIWAESDQTVTFMLQVDDGTPADVDSVDLAPAAGEAEDTSLDGDTTVAAGEELDLAITSVSGTPTWVSICFTGNWAD